MYRRFNFTGNFPKENYGEFHKRGEELYEEFKTEIEDSLDKYLLNGGYLDGSKMQEDWFPSNVKADIFLSHSHENIDEAKAFAGWLNKKFGVKVFIDACVWKYSNDLLKKIDDRHCKITDTTSYDYNKRNYSTSHVHMMLSTALTKMINKTECLIFFNTPASIHVEGLISKTESPWIYHEIAMSNLLPSITPDWLIEVEEKHFSEIRNVLEKADISGRLRALYNVDLRNFQKITKANIVAIFNQGICKTKYDFLEELYKLHRIKPLALQKILL